jgi:16S rRNA (cytosine967-C5)-methyltransferase
MNEYVTAVRALIAMAEDHRHLDGCFPNTVTPLSQQIAYGVVRHYFFLNTLTDKLLAKPLADKHQDIHWLLLAGLYSIDHLKRPAHASVNACVEATAGMKKPWAKGLVNGVLRRYGREGQALQQSANENIEARLDHPGWLIDAVRSAYPKLDGLFAVNNERAPMTLRVNRLRITRENYLAKLQSAGLSAIAGELSGSAVLLEQPVSVSTLPGFHEGEVSVQDEAPQLAPSLMNLSAGLRVLDACAAPGGKTCHLLESCEGLRLTAVDRDKKRIHRIEENLLRLSLEAEVICADLESLNDDKRFDRILLDVPCSATGIIRRHPDIKLLREHEDIAKLSLTQRVLLKKAFELLSHGGELLYSTCSILPAENDDVIAAFLHETPEAELLPVGHPDLNTYSQYGLQLLPASGSHDGFYYSSIRKTHPGSSGADR